MDIDRFGSRHAPNLSFARGDILRNTEDDFKKLQVAWSLIRRRGLDRIYVFTGLETLLIIRSSGGVEDALGIGTSTDAAGTPILVCGQIVPQKAPKDVRCHPTTRRQGCWTPRKTLQAPC